VAQLDDLAAFLQTRMDAAARDRLLYGRDGARFNAQLLQGELNMGAAVLAWIERARAGTESGGESEELDDEAAGD
jgi:hypothetical protein